MFFLSVVLQIFLPGVQYGDKWNLETCLQMVADDSEPEFEKILTYEGMFTDEDMCAGHQWNVRSI